MKLSIEKSFSTYIEDLEEPLESFLLEKSKEHDQALYLLKTYYLYMCFIADTQVLKNCHVATQILFSKAAQDIFGIYNCLKSGCIFQSLVIYRGLVETDVTVKFISLDNDYRSTLYYEHKFIEKYQQFQKIPLSVENIDYIIKKYNEIQHKYNKNSFWYTKLLQKLFKEDSQLKERYKNRPTIKAMADSAGMLSEYNSMYQLMSKATHGSSLLDHLLIQENRVTTSPNFNKGWIDKITALSIGNAHHILETIIEVNEIDKEYVLLSHLLQHYSLFNE